MGLRSSSTWGSEYELPRHVSECARGNGVSFDNPDAMPAMPKYQTRNRPRLHSVTESMLVHRKE
jgi:hypothetical protein